MSKIENLIKELCPEGVKRVKLGDVCEIKRGKRVVRKDLALEGNIPVYQNSLVPLGYSESSNYPADTTFVISAGAAGEVGYSCIPMWAADDCLAFSCSNNILAKYAFLVLKNQESQLKSQIRGGAIKRLAKDVVTDLSIPLPPLPIQQEIVSILDKFTEQISYIDKSIELRQKQYEYYREKLLTFEEGECEWKKIKDIEVKHCSGSTPNKAHPEFYEGGTIPWLRTQDVKFNEIYEIDSFVTEEALHKTSVKWIPENCVIVAISGATAGRCAINKIKTTTNQHCLNIEIDKEKAEYKYVFCCLRNQYQDLLALKQGARGDLNSASILGVKIPLPPLPRQRSIVATLDKFETLIADLKQMRELRQKQYEYYREKLLTF